MSVFRVHKTENYSIIANYHFKEKGLSLKAKGLLSLMLSLPDTWHYSISGLVTLSKDGKDSVMAALAELEEFGYLKRTRVTNDKGQFSGVQYDIFEQPQAKEPVAGTQNSAKAKAAKPPAISPQLLNNKELKDRFNKENIHNKKLKRAIPIASNESALVPTDEELEILMKYAASLKGD